MATANSISRTVRLCRWRARVNPLWLWAYCALVLLLQAYLLYRAVIRCKQYNELPWRTEDKPVLELYVYISLIVISVMCVPFFIITSIFKVNNYSGDGIRLGRDNIHEEELAEAAGAISLADPSGSTSNLGNESPTDDYIETMPQKPIMTSQKTCGGKMHALWCHIGPFSHGFHIVSAFSLLLPSILLEAQEIKYGFQNPESVWSSELDVLLGWRSFRASSDYVVEYNPLVENTTPHDTKNPLTPSDSRSASEIVSPEYINYILALGVYGVRYAAVFWYTRMSFSILFSLQMLIITTHFAFSFCGMGLLYKFQVNAKGFADIHLVLPASVTLILYMLGSTMLLLHGLPMFNYGFQHYMERWHKFLKSYAPSYFKKKRIVNSCQGYSPHVMATVVLILVIACRGAIVYEYVILYRKTGFPVILGSIIMDALYMVSWISLWFALTIKQSWSFRLMFARYVMPSSRRPLSKRISNLNSSQILASERNSPDGNEDSTTCNGKTITTEAEILDGNDAQNPGSALRKSSNRRSLTNQRVKFDKASKENTGDSNKDNKKKGVRRVQSDSSSHKGSKTDIPEIESSSESTLTRTYRNSVRDKCGQYYVIGREISPPPAAQSSPRIDDKRSGTKGPLDEGIIMNPLAADKQYPVNHAYSADPDRSVQQKHSPDGVPLRYHPPSQSKDNLSSSRHPDARYSYPLVGPWIPPGSYDTYNASPPKYPHIHGPVSREPRSARRSLQLERPLLPNLHEGSYLSNQDLYKNNGRQRSHNVTKPGGNTEDSNKPPTPPRPPRPPNNQSKAVRELRYKKPDLSHRDSALPSSNETSSNDSNDILCSQV